MPHACSARARAPSAAASDSLHQTRTTSVPSSSGA